jgi:hypothetical protein
VRFFARSPTIGKVLHDLRGTPTFSLPRPFPVRCLSQSTPAPTPVRGARTGVRMPQISWNKGVSEPEIRLAQVYPEDE